MDTKNIIRQNRVDNKLKQSYISLVTGMTQSNYSQIESGKIKPSIDQIEKIAGVYGKTATQFIEEACGDIKIEHNNHPNSNNQSKNGRFYNEKLPSTEHKLFEQVIESKNETILNQKETIVAQKSQIDLFKSQTKLLQSQMVFLQSQIAQLQSQLAELKIGQ